MSNRRGAYWKRRLEEGLMMQIPDEVAPSGSPPVGPLQALPVVELSYAAVSMSQPEGRAREWKVPLWDAINALIANGPDNVQTRSQGLVNAIEGAVERAMKLAVETSVSERPVVTPDKCPRCGFKFLSVSSTKGKP